MWIRYAVTTVAILGCLAMTPAEPGSGATPTLDAGGDAAPALALVGLGGARAQDEAHSTVFEADGLEWQAGPPSLPEGAEVVVLEGAPAEEGPLTLRLRFPAGYEIPAHTHPALEHVTVLSGSFSMGMGEAMDREAGTTVGPGGFMVIPVGMAHFAWVDEATVIQLHSVGPWGIDYVNPDDDPRE